MEQVRSFVMQAVDPVRSRSERLRAFGELVARFQGMACGYAYSILGDFHVAEDAAQEAFVLAYRQLADLREPAAFDLRQVGGFGLGDSSCCCPVHGASRAAGK